MSHDISVEKVAALARISKNLSQEEKQVYKNEMESILKYVDELQNTDLNGISTVVTDITNTIDDLREDVPESGQNYERVRQNIIKNFPNSNNNLLILPGIFEE